jgi:Fe-S-cluster containining protein
LSTYFGKLLWTKPDVKINLGSCFSSSVRYNYYRKVTPMFIINQADNNNPAVSFEGLEALLAFYREVDTVTNEFKKQGKVDCLRSCRECCRTSAANIEVSVFEFLPLSIHLWQTGKAEFWLARAAAAAPDSPCVLLNENALFQPEGGCRFYAWRPLLCRLFGFSAVEDKYGQPVISLCRRITQKNPGLRERLQAQVESGLPVPINSSYARRVSLLNPALGQTRYPINKALLLALETTGFRLALAGEDGHPRETPPDVPPVGKPA